MAELSDPIELAWDDRLATAEQAEVALRSGRLAPFAAADQVTGIVSGRPDAEPLAWRSPTS